MARPVDLAKGSRFLVLASICVVVAALYLAQEVLIPLALSLLLAFLLTPLVRALERLGLGRVSSTLIVVCSSLALVVVLTWVVTRQMIRLAEDLPRYQTNIIRHVHDLRRKGGTIENVINKTTEVIEKTSREPETQPTQPTTVPSEFTPMTWQQFLEAVRRPPAPPQQAVGESPAKPVFTSEVDKPEPPLKILFGNVTKALGPLGTAGVVVIFVLFMLLQREDLRDRIIRLVGKGQIHVTTTALTDAGKRISRYMFAQAIVNGSYGIAISIGLYLIGRIFGRDEAGNYLAFPSVVLWGLLCAVLRFIPYIGPWIAAAFPVTLAFAVYPGYAPFAAVLIMFVAVELLSNNVMEPWLYGSSTGISTLAILVAAVFWTWLWGPIGLLLSTPLTACLVVIGKYVPQLQFLDILLGDEPVLEPPDRLYQRLLAGDQEEAGELVETYLQNQSLEEVYDQVMLPALAMSKQDRRKGRLDEERHGFVLQSMRDIIDELRDQQQLLDRQELADQHRTAAAQVVEAARTGAQALSPAPGGNGASASATSTSTVRTTLPQGCVVNVVILPAHDDADEIAGLMLAHLLELRGFCAFPVGVAKLASEMLDSVKKKKADMVIVSALPPAAVTHARYLCKRLQGRFEQLNMIIGLWTLRGDLGKARERIVCDTTVQIVPTFAQALEQVQQMAQPLVVRETGTVKT